jgi:hypothetical protein
MPAERETLSARCVGANDRLAIAGRIDCMDIKGVVTRLEPAQEVDRRAFVDFRTSTDRRLFQVARAIADASRQSHGRAAHVVDDNGQSHPLAPSCGDGTRGGHHGRRRIDEDAPDAVCLGAAAHATIAAGCLVCTDGWSGYAGLGEGSFDHRARSLPTGAEIDAWLPWSHIVLSNFKRWTLDVFHGVSPAHLQAYLDEFCYRLNRRAQRLDLFRRILNRCLLYTELAPYWGWGSPAPSAPEALHGAELLRRAPVGQTAIDWPSPWHGVTATLPRLRIMSHSSCPFDDGVGIRLHAAARTTSGVA